MSISGGNGQQVIAADHRLSASAAPTKRSAGAAWCQCSTPMAEGNCGNPDGVDDALMLMVEEKYEIVSGRTLRRHCPGGLIGWNCHLQTDVIGGLASCRPRQPRQPKGNGPIDTLWRKV